MIVLLDKESREGSCTVGIWLVEVLRLVCAT